MSQIIITGLASQKIAAGPTQIQIVSSQLASGITIFGNTFIPGSVADFWVNADLYVDAIGSVRAYTLELFNETTQTLIQATTVNADSTGIGDYQSFIFGLPVTDATHAFSLRVRPTGGGDQTRLNIIMSRWLVSSFASGGGTVGPGTVGRVAKFTAANAVGDSSVYDTGDIANQNIGIGLLNLVGNVNSASRSSAFGVSNQIAQNAFSNNSNSFGYGNTADNGNNISAFGSYNNVGSAAYSAAKSSAFGYGNLISAGALCAQGSAVGYGNRIADNAYSPNSNAFGTSNHVNASEASAFGIGNLVGLAPYTATKSSAFGYGNQIGQTANSDNATAVGYKNTALGNRSSVFGYNCSAEATDGNGYFSTAVGINCIAGYVGVVKSAAAFGVGSESHFFGGLATGIGCKNLATNGTALGYKAISRVATTANICGPIINRKDAAESFSAADKFTFYGGVEVVLMSENIDFTSAAADTEIAIPAGAEFYIDEIDIIATNIAGLVTQPTVRAGISGTPAKYLAAVLTTQLTATRTRQVFSTLLADNGETSANNLSVGWTVPANAGTFRGRFVIRGILIESQP